MPIDVPVGSLVEERARRGDGRREPRRLHVGRRHRARRVEREDDRRLVARHVRTTCGPRDADDQRRASATSARANGSSPRHAARRGTRFGDERGCPERGRLALAPTLADEQERRRAAGSPRRPSSAWAPEAHRRLRLTKPRGRGASRRRSRARRGRRPRCGEVARHLLPLLVRRGPAKRFRRPASLVSTRSRAPVSGSTSQTSPRRRAPPRADRGSRRRARRAGRRGRGAAGASRAGRGSRRRRRRAPAAARRAASARERGASSAREPPDPFSPFVAEREQEPDEAGSTLRRRQGSASRRRSDEADAVPAHAGGVTERERHAHRDVGLAAIGRPEPHRRRLVEHDPRDEHALGELHADVRLRVRAVTFQSIRRTSSPGSYGLTCASSLPRPSSAERWSPASRPSTRRADRELERPEQRLRHRPRAGPLRRRDDTERRGALSSRGDRPPELERRQRDRRDTASSTSSAVRCSASAR